MIRLILTILILFVAQFNSVSQNIELSEKKLSDKTISDTERVELLNTLSRDITFSNSVRAVELAEEALRLSVKMDDQQGIAFAYRNLSNVHLVNENFFQSMDYLQRALDIFNTLKDSIGIANCYINLGHTYRRLHNRTEEISYHKKSFDIFSRLKIPERIGVAAHNLGESYFNNLELDKSRDLTLYAIKVNDSIKNLPVLSSCYKVMGMLEYTKNNLQQAEIYFSNVLKISSQLGVNSQKTATIESMVQLAVIYKITGRKKLQLEWLKKGAEFSQQNNLSGQLQVIYTELILYFSGTNNQQEVKKYVTEYNSVAASIDSKQRKDRADLTNSAIQVYKLESEKKYLLESGLLQAERISNRNFTLALAIVFVLILAGFTIGLWRAKNRMKKTNLILITQKEIIESQNHRLEELNNIKDKFFSVVAHDMRAPLHSFKSFSILITKHIEHLSKEEMSKMGEQLQVAVDNTIKMADNLLTWASIQMKDVDTHPDQFYVGDTISTVLEVYKDVAEKKGIVVDCLLDDTLTVYADKNQIAFAIRNLVNNAIKFTPVGGEIKLTTIALPAEVQISVADNGIGIPESIKEKLFSIGRSKSINGTSGEKGTGLGLMLSHEFIKLNNGTIRMESEEGKGTTFTISLPREPSNQL